MSTWSACREEDDGLVLCVDHVRKRDVGDEEGYEGRPAKKGMASPAQLVMSAGLQSPGIAPEAARAESPNQPV